MKAKFGSSYAEIMDDLDSILDDADDSSFISVLGSCIESVSTNEKSEEEKGHKLNVSVNLAANPSVNGGVSSHKQVSCSQNEERQSTDIFMRVFNLKELLRRLKAILKNMSIKHLYIFIDDFSELPHDAMKIVVDTLMAPLNNWSEEMVKLKVAGYPGRIYYGDIDKTKIDEISLDIYKLYGTTDVAAMEDKAIDFTKRLVQRRLKYYCKCDAKLFIEQDNKEIWRMLFYATMSNPRNLGYLLYYVYESHIIYGKPLNQKAVGDAARKYYEDKVGFYFSANKFLHETFNERSSIFSLKELLEAIVNKARELRYYKDSDVMREQPRPRTSHFHVIAGVEELLSTLELNFFLTKYYEVSDRDGRKVSVFALNYGLCERYNIEFGRPTGHPKYRHYFVERIFDYTSILHSYIKSNQEIICDYCDNRFDQEQLEALKLYGMRCPKCNIGACTVVNLSRKYEVDLTAINNALLLPATELGILHTLQTEDKALFASDIGAELDCSYQLVGKRAKFLADRGFVTREKSEGRREFEITDLAKKTYFVNPDHDSLDIQDAD